MATYVILIDVYMLPGYNYELLNSIIVWKLIRVWSSTHTVGGIVHRYNHKIKQKYQYSSLSKAHQYVTQSGKTGLIAYLKVLRNTSYLPEHPLCK